MKIIRQKEFVRIDVNSIDRALDTTMKKITPKLRNKLNKKFYQKTVDNGIHSQEALDRYLNMKKKPKLVKKPKAPKEKVRQVMGKNGEVITMSPMVDNAINASVLAKHRCDEAFALTVGSAAGRAASGHLGLVGSAIYNAVPVGVGTGYVAGKNALMFNKNAKGVVKNYVRGNGTIGQKLITRKRAQTEKMIDEVKSLRSKYNRARQNANTQIPVSV